MREEKSKATNSTSKSTEAGSSTSETSSQSSSTNVPATILIPQRDPLAVQPKHVPVCKPSLPSDQVHNGNFLRSASTSRSIHTARSPSHLFSMSSTDVFRNDFSVPFEVYSRWEACLSNDKKQWKTNIISRGIQMEIKKSSDRERVVPKQEEEERLRGGETVVQGPGQKSGTTSAYTVNQLPGDERLAGSPSIIQDEMLMTASIGSYDEDDIPMEISSLQA